MDQTTAQSLKVTGFTLRSNDETIDDPSIDQLTRGVELVMRAIQDRTKKELQETLLSEAVFVTDSGINESNMSIVNVDIEANLRGRKAMGDKIELIEVNKDFVSVNSAKNLDITNQVARLQTLTGDTDGQQRIAAFIEYESERNDPAPKKGSLTTEEKPQFKKWVRSYLQRYESEKRGPNVVEAKFLAYAHGCKLISEEILDKLAQDNQSGIYEPTWTWIDCNLIDIFRDENNIAPCGHRRDGRASCREVDAGDRSFDLGARIVG